MEPAASPFDLLVSMSTDVVFRLPVRGAAGGPRRRRRRRHHPLLPVHLRVPGLRRPAPLHPRPRDPVRLRRRRPARQRAVRRRGRRHGPRPRRRLRRRMDDLRHRRHAAGRRHARLADLGCRCPLHDGAGHLPPGAARPVSGGSGGLGSLTGPTSRRRRARRRRPWPCRRRRRSSRCACRRSCRRRRRRPCRWRRRPCSSCWPEQTLDLVHEPHGGTSSVRTPAWDHEDRSAAPSPTVGDRCSTRGPTPGSDDILPALADYIAIPALSPSFEPDWDELGPHRAPRSSTCGPGARPGRSTASPSTSTAPRAHPGGRGGGGGVAGRGCRRHRAALRPPRQAAADGRVARRPRPVHAGAAGRPPLRAGRCRRRLRRPSPPSPPSRRSRPPAAATPAASSSSRRARSRAAPTSRPTSRPSPTRIGEPSLVVCLDSGCATYDRLWVTTSLRGLVGVVLRVAGARRRGALGRRRAAWCRRRSGSLRQLLDRIEDAAHRRPARRRAPRRVPADRAAELAATGGRARRRRRRRGSRWSTGSRCQPGDDPEAAAPGPDLGALARLRRAPTGCPPIGIGRQRAAHPHHPQAVASGCRRPSTPPPRPRRCGPALDADPPYGAAVTVDVEELGAGVERARRSSPWLARCPRRRAPQAAFGQPARTIGEGGSIPFMAMLGERFPARPVPRHRRARARAATPTAPTSSSTCRARPAVTARGRPRPRRPRRRRPR